MKPIKFTKMHGIGNDYIMINCIDGYPDDLSSLAIEMSTRHSSVGADGIIAIGKSELADFKVCIYNADGSEAKMCGNGCRCAGKYVYDKKLVKNKHISFETLSGIKHLELHLHNSVVTSATIDMGIPILKTNEIPLNSNLELFVEQPITTVNGMRKITAVSIGNPHGVIFVNDLSSIDLTKEGHALEYNEIWPDRANIEFAQVINRERIAMKVWERGSGITMACGSGACATAVVGAITGRTDRKVTICLPGGELNIKWDTSNNHIFLNGPTETVYEGNYVRKNQKKSIQSPI